jgi:hypothetical protein
VFAAIVSFTPVLVLSHQSKVPSSKVSQLRVIGGLVVVLLVDVVEDVVVLDELVLVDDVEVDVEVEDEVEVEVEVEVVDVDVLVEVEVLVLVVVVVVVVVLGQSIVSSS